MAKSVSELKSFWESGSVSGSLLINQRYRGITSHLHKQSSEIYLETAPLVLNNSDNESSIKNEEESKIQGHYSLESCSSGNVVFDNGSLFETDTEGHHTSDLSSPNDSSEFRISETDKLWDCSSSDSSDSFSKQLRELESSLKFDSPEKWLFGITTTSSSCISSEPDLGFSSRKIEEPTDECSDNEIESPSQTDQITNLFSNDVRMSLIQCDSELVDNKDQQQCKAMLTEDFSFSASLNLPFCDNLFVRRQRSSFRRKSSSLSLETEQPLPSSLSNSDPKTVSDNSDNALIVHMRHRRTSSALAPLCCDGSSRLLEAFEVKIEKERKSVEGECKQTRRMAARKSKVIQELLDTEITYQTHLALVIKYFQRPLQKMSILSDHVVLTIFGNIEQLMALNTELLIHLKSLGVGEAFCRLGPFLKLYSTYANNHERALAALMEWDQKCSEFARFRRTQEELPDMKGLKLNALLITPVQRIPRYKLLLEELLLSTSPCHEDYKNIGEAVKLVSAVANHINEHIKQQDNFMKMLAIQKSISGPAGLQILIPGRVFIKEGMLHKVSKKGDRSRERLFLLFSDVLMYARPRLLDGAGANSFTCCCILPLHHCKVDQVFGHSQGQGSLFSIQCKDELLLLFSDQKSVNAWMIALQKAIDEVQTSRHSLRKNSSAKEPMRGDAMIQYLKKEKKTDPLIAKKTKQKKSSDEQKILESYPASEEHACEQQNASTANRAPKKPRLGFACLNKNRRKVFPEFANWKFVKGSPFAKENCSVDTSGHTRFSKHEPMKQASTQNTGVVASSPKTKFCSIQNSNITSKETLDPLCDGEFSN